MSDTEIFGTPARPMMVRCTSLGDQGGEVVYVSAVTEKGSHVHLGFTRGQAQLLGLQMLNAALKDKG